MNIICKDNNNYDNCIGFHPILSDCKERNDEDNMEAINDLSEDMCKEIDNIYQAIAELSVKPQQVEQPRNPIRYKK